LLTLERRDDKVPKGGYQTKKYMGGGGRGKRGESTQRGALWGKVSKWKNRRNRKKRGNKSKQKVEAPWSELRQEHTSGKSFG